MEPANSREERLTLSEKRDMFYETFRTNIRLLRHYNCKSAVEMANELEFSKLKGGKRIIDLEYGRANPTIDECIMFAKYFKVSLSDLMERESKVAFIDAINGIAYVVMTAEIYKP